jgi:hypothetical protein
MGQKGKTVHSLETELGKDLHVWGLFQHLVYVINGLCMKFQVLDIKGLVEMTECVF